MRAGFGIAKRRAGNRARKEMSKTAVRQPKQERSIETKNKIIQAGYELFSENGYYGTTTQDIAKRAGVSTGIVYGYFEDKRDILACVLHIYIKDVSEPLMAIMSETTAPVNVISVTRSIIDKTIELHGQNANLHNVLHSLAPSDELVQQEFMTLENHVTLNMSKRLKELGVNCDDMNEKVHLAMNVIQSFAHEFVFDKHQYIDYGAMRSIVEKVVAELFKQD